MTALIYPIYLDVPMMVSFLATLEGGVSYSGEIVEKAASELSRERAAEGRLGLPSLTQLLGLSLDLSGRLRRGSREEETVERKVVREHTEASLFNILIERLHDENTVVDVSVALSSVNFLAQREPDGVG